MDFHNWKFQDDTPVYLQLYNKLLYAILRGSSLAYKVAFPGSFPVHK